MPSVPSFPAPRREAERPTAGREYESFDWYEEIIANVPAGSAFSEIGRFSGRPGKVILRSRLATAEIRFRRLGGPPGDAIRVRSTDVFEVATGEQIVEARDVAGAGGDSVQVTGLIPTRHIDRRDTAPGPRLSDVRAREQGAPEQLDPR